MAERTSKLPGVRARVGGFPSIAISMGRANSFQGIASTLGKVTDDLHDQADRAAVVKATRKGTIAGATGTPEITGESTLAGQAFDNAARQSFANKSELSIRVNLDRISNENKADPAAYMKAATGYLSGMVREIDQVDPAMAAVVGEKFKLDIASQEQQISKVHTSLLAESRKSDAIILTDQIRRDMKKIAPDLVSGDPQKGLEGLERINIERARLETILSGTGPDGLPMFDQSSITKTLLDFDQDMFQDIAREWVRGQPDKVAALEAIESDTAEIDVAVIDEKTGEAEKSQMFSLTEGMTPESKTKLLGFANQQITAENSERQRGLRASAEQVADLEIAIDNGTADLDDIQKAQDNGLFEDRQQKRATLTKAWLTRQEALRKSQGDLTRVTDAINGELILDPKNKDDKKSVDGYWKSAKRQIAAETSKLPEDQKRSVEKTLGVNLVQRTGIIPKSMKGEIIGSMRSGTTEQRVSAADMIDRLNQLPGNVLADEMTKRDIALALQISSLVNAGQDPEQAVAAAISSTDPTNKPVIEARQQTIRQDKLEDNYAGIVKGHFNPTTILDFIPFGPDDDAELTTVDGTKSRAIADYKVLFEDWFIRTGDKEQAKTQALKDLGRVWGVTRVDGSVRVMKYAPEAFYGVGVGVDDADWMKAQLHSDIKTLDPKLTPDSIMLGSDNRTAREAKARVPTYPVLIKQPSGAFEPLRLDGKLVRWSPDASETKKKLVKGKIDSAKRKRDRKITFDSIEEDPALADRLLQLGFN